MNKPYLVDFPKVGAIDVGFISIAEVSSGLPFQVKRVFWTYHTPESIVRGRHAHHQTAQVLIAVSGRIVVLTELTNGEVQTYVLDRPNLGLYIPPYCWHTMQYSRNAVQMVLASTEYNADDYIRDYIKFKQLHIN